ncbi:MAG: phosphatase PAP2 family protein [Salibacteraceae bacterium]
MKKIWQLHKLYFVVYLIFVVLSAYILTQYNKTEIHLYFNSFYSEMADLFFQYLTYVGDGITIALITSLSLFISLRIALQIGLTGIISGAIAQILKKVVFGPTPRPSKYFSDLDIPLRYVEGVELHTAFSFPSGHTTAVFALTTSILLLLPKRNYDISLILIALLTGFSRIYLSQHFLSDVLLGSFIGILTALLVHSFIFSDKQLANKKLDNPLINLSKK